MIPHPNRSQRTNFFEIGRNQWRGRKLNRYIKESNVQCREINHKTQFKLNERGVGILCIYLYYIDYILNAWSSLEIVEKTVEILAAATPIEEAAPVHNRDSDDGKQKSYLRTQIY